MIPSSIPSDELLTAEQCEQIIDREIDRVRASEFAARILVRVNLRPVDSSVLVCEGGIIDRYKTGGWNVGLWTRRTPNTYTVTLTPRQTLCHDEP